MRMNIFPSCCLPLRFLQCLLGELLVPARPLLDNGAQIKVTCVTLLSRLDITSWMGLWFLVKAFSGTAGKIIGVVKDIKIRIGKLKGPITMFGSKNCQGNYLLSLPFVDFGSPPQIFACVSKRYPVGCGWKNSTV